ncbi:MAG: sulfite exporter TauE/SafE family protein [Crocinitomicaceae bacterium]
MDSTYVFLAFLPVVAFLYASVGHGGASGYLALMALFSFAPETMKPTALLLNLFVAGISFTQFALAGHFKMRLFAVFAALSIPLSFVGGTVSIDSGVYKVVLGILLLFAIVRMLGWMGNGTEKRRFKFNSSNIAIGLLIGSAIGFFSGLIGIGGGIILSPVILLLGWGSVKEAAAVSALFIWVNSAAGLGGQLYTGVTLDSEVWLYAGIAVIGGFFGSYFGSQRWNVKVLRYVLAFVLVLASVKLIWTGI